MNRGIWVMMVLALAWLSSPTWGEESPEFKWPETPTGETEEQLKTALTGTVSDLSNPNPAIRRLASKEYARERHDLINGLIDLAQKGADRSFNGPVHLAINLLGEYRAVEAVDALAARLTYLPSGPVAISDGLRVRESYYPCADALRKIGGPAVPTVARLIGAVRDDTGEVRLAAWVIMEVEGKDAGARRLQAQFKDTHDDRCRVRIQAALAYVTAYKPNYAIPYLDRTEPKEKPARNIEKRMGIQAK